MKQNCYFFGKFHANLHELYPNYPNFQIVVYELSREIKLQNISLNQIFTFKYNNLLLRLIIVFLVTSKQDISLKGVYKSY